VYGHPASPFVAVSPGRVNLIGEHTDYNDGYVLPMALDRYVAVAFAANGREVVRAHSADHEASAEIALERLKAPGGSDWYDYIAGTLWALKEDGYAIPGLDIVVTGNVPIGAGLSSSAAIEVATARATAKVAGFPWDVKKMAALAQRAENTYVGMPCGIMDQLAVSAGEEGCALLLDCRSLETTAIRLPDDGVIVVMDTATRRALVDGAYAERRRSCERVVEVLKRRGPAVSALRDASLDMLEDARNEMSGVELERATHVVTENQRTLDMAEALRTGDLECAGRLMNASHVSLRDHYEVSSQELDVISSLAREHPACWGARMTGAGFGGCGVAMIRAEEAEAFVSEVTAAYREETGLPGVLTVCLPVAGAHLV
jgi:galactokinase